jgi:hypothetical protein
MLKAWPLISEESSILRVKISGLSIFLALVDQESMLLISISHQLGKLKKIGFSSHLPQFNSSATDSLPDARSEMLPRVTFLKDLWFSDHSNKDLPSIWKFQIMTTFMVWLVQVLQNLDLQFTVLMY